MGTQLSAPGWLPGGTRLCHRIDRTWDICCGNGAGVGGWGGVVVKGMVVGTRKSCLPKPSVASSQLWSLKQFP